MTVPLIIVKPLSTMNDGVSPVEFVFAGLTMFEPVFKAVVPSHNWQFVKSSAVFAVAKVKVGKTDVTLTSSPEPVASNTKFANVSPFVPATTF